MLIAAPHCMLSAAPPCMQVPAEKRVYVHDEGKNELGLARSWYRVAPVPPPCMHVLTTTLSSPQVRGRRGRHRWLGACVRPN